MFQFSKLKKLMDNNGVTAYKLSKETNISQSSFTDWKKEKANPSYEKLKELALYFNVDINYFDNNYSGDSSKPKKKKGTVIPVLGIVPCGIPLEAIEDIIDTEEISEELSKTGTFFGLIAKGDSMATRIMEGDVLIVKQCDVVESGKVAIVKVNGDEATCKKVLINDGGITLMPFNNQYEPVYYTKEDIKKLPITIVGQVVEVRGKL
ncbi:XRE family transcriptional regulator [Breznakia sp. OttesenSCG-928-G09]|nr:XRE family transcriptional regulator [Breznakia sp. OttesenSCG-928-G09]